MTDHLLQTARDWHRAGRGVAIATVVETWGSAPRGVGSLLIIDDTGRMEGSVSGGCVEGAVILEALDAIPQGTARLLDYGVSDDAAFAVGLACGGRIRVLVEPVGGAMPIPLLTALVDAITARQPIAYVTDLDGGPPTLADPAAYPERFRLDRSGVEDDARTFVAIHNPPLRMIVVGAVHIAQALLPMARACGFDPVLIDPRGAFGSADRFPGETILEDWPDAAMAALAPDSRTAVVTLTHDPKLDDPAIAATLRSGAFYLGCLGSKRTHAKRVDRLTADGFGADDIARIHAPVGLDLGGRAPAEIAVSIMAQVIATLRRPA
ncbi:xanthine dehydrogenase accessory factor [Loktanella fryxellensis]|uniref:Xanthine dehydrogenase accessory factor n=1 Tax=Loktanella fryxellensis TaxID=245187 RepID=A0A1H7YW48_9RHOB|nr:XdhC family protein [Loktanella fryxellensis]SEM49588.1 xanthine dehydrogenase accessory factor [Loktanella fryxellensis]